MVQATSANVWGLPAIHCSRLPAAFAVHFSQAIACRLRLRAIAAG
ncbi:hypothetical protein CLOSTASPAR_01764 [[Clostridium] asparagiforme DSM 15981]|uniref:Uncharacterized protein n=1 Tax=[Clostridium] asparagiforme DSM 15981 TaxID=518636 RepID=C0CXN9_9FIRM|nr:hypothetical protein CLOSTASPAR_01764 [[Clostridium] asparagiforme DSM 15981]